jgi:M6 family metalloprotease-like protein
MQTIQKFAGLIAILILCATVSTPVAMQLNGDIRMVQQPGGALVTVKVWGNEYYKHTETPEGYTVVRDTQSLALCYAMLSANESALLSTGEIYLEDDSCTGRSTQIATAKNLAKHLHITAAAAHELTRQRQLAAPLPKGITASTPDSANSVIASSGLPAPVVGNIKGLTILIDFAELPWNSAPLPVTPDTMADLFNTAAPGPRIWTNVCSINQYFKDVSNNQLNFTGIVPSAYYRAPHPLAYYDGEDPTLPFRAKARELIVEALAWLDNAGFDFSTVTTFINPATGRREVACLNIFYYGQPMVGGGLESHCSLGAQYHSNDSDIWTNAYGIDCIAIGPTIANCIHNTSHMLFGWPDLYDYGVLSEASAGIGRYCIMADGGPATEPLPPCAYLRIRAGWETVSDISVKSPGETLTLLSNATTSTYKYANPATPWEYFLIESRCKTGLAIDHNAYLPDEGLMVWHIDESLPDSAANDRQGVGFINHYKVKLVQADGLNHLENDVNTGGAGDLFHAGGKATFNDNDPQCRWWSNNYSGFGLKNISAVGPSMTVTLAQAALNSTPLSYTIQLYKGQIAQNTLTISNPGSDTLFWQANAMHKPGYVYSNSDQPDGPPFVWQDISTTGRFMQELCDNASEWAQEPLSFPFPFFDTTLSTIIVSSWGYILASQEIPKCDFDLPSVFSAFNGSRIDPYWYEGNDTIYMQDFGDKVIFQYTNVGGRDYPGESTFQIVLKQDGTISVYLKEMNSPLTNAASSVYLVDKTRLRNLLVHPAGDGLFYKNNFAMQFTPTAATYRQRLNKHSGAVPSAGSDVVTITADATLLAPGTYLDTVVINHSVPGTQPVRVPITLTVLNNGLTASPAACNFGSLPIGGSSSAPISLTNNSTTQITVNAVSIPSGMFSTTLTTPITILPWQTYEMTVTFSPIAAGFQSSVLTIQSTSPNNPVLTVALSGTGASSRNLAPDSPSLSFGNVPVGRSDTLQVGLVNNGDLPTTIWSITCNNVLYKCIPSPSAPLTVEGGATLPVLVIFTPLDGGTQVGALSVVSNAVDHPTLAVPLSGSGTLTMYMMKNPPRIGPTGIAEMTSSAYTVRRVTIGTVIAGKSANANYKLYIK